MNLEEEIAIRIYAGLISVHHGRMLREDELQILSNYARNAAHVFIETSRVAHKQNKVTGGRSA